MELKKCSKLTWALWKEPEVDTYQIPSVSTFLSPPSPTSQPNQPLHTAAASETGELRRREARVSFPLLPRPHGRRRSRARGPPPAAAAAAAGAGARAPGPRRAKTGRVPVPREHVGGLRGRGRLDGRAPGPGPRLPGDLRVRQHLDRIPRRPRAGHRRRHPAVLARHVCGRVQIIAPQLGQGDPVPDPIQEGIGTRKRCSFLQLMS